MAKRRTAAKMTAKRKRRASPFMLAEGNQRAAPEQKVQERHRMTRIPVIQFTGGFNRTTKLIGVNYGLKAA
jgi:hypothetical protein